jgi:hypothetical protein
MPSSAGCSVRPACASGSALATGYPAVPADRYAFVNPSECCATVVDISVVRQQSPSELAQLPEHVRDLLVLVPAALLEEYEALNARIEDFNQRALALRPQP